MHKIVIGCDNAAIRLKHLLKEFMEAKGYEVDDVGCHSTTDNIYYPYIAQTVCAKIIDSNYQKQGVLICGTGLGMAMTANKFKGIRAGVCHDIFSAERLRLSNDGNILCLGERVIGVELAKMILERWLTLDYIDGPSTPKINALRELETINLK